MIVTSGLGSGVLITQGFGWLTGTGEAPPSTQIPVAVGRFRRKRREDENLELLLALIGELS